VWRTDIITSINFWNAYRHWDPNQRPGGAPTLLESFTGTAGNNVIKIASGYNVSLQYEKDTETLYVRGIPGAGKGLPDEIPWDTGPPAGAENNIKSFNGLFNNVQLSGSASVDVKQVGNNEIDLEVS